MNLIHEIARPDSLLRACWLGNDGWLFGHEGHLIATDLDLFLPERLLPRFDELPELARRLNYLLVTHTHTDHFNPQTIMALLEHGHCTVILPESCRSCASEYGFDLTRILYAKPGRIPLDQHNNPLPLPSTGGVVPGLPDWIRIEAIQALHGHIGGSVYAGANAGDCGYVIEFGGKRIVQPGDSVLLQEHLALDNVDLLLVSPTEHNMGIAQSRYLIEAIHPKRVFAQHFLTYHETAENAFWTHGYQQELQDALTPALRERYAIPEYTRPYTIF